MGLGENNGGQTNRRCAEVSFARNARIARALRTGTRTRRLPRLASVFPAGAVPFPPSLLPSHPRRGRHARVRTWPTPTWFLYDSAVSKWVKPWVQQHQTS